MPVFVSWLHLHKVKDLYVNLSKCREGETVGFFCSQDPAYGTDTWYLVLNGRIVHKLAVKVPHERYAVVDVYGQCIEVEVLPLRDATALKEVPTTQAKMSEYICVSEAVLWKLYKSIVSMRILM